MIEIKNYPQKKKSIFLILLAVIMFVGFNFYMIIKIFENNNLK